MTSSQAWGPPTSVPRKTRSKHAPQDAGCSPGGVPAVWPVAARAGRLGRSGRRADGSLVELVPLLGGSAGETKGNPFFFGSPLFGHMPRCLQSLTSKHEPPLPETPRTTIGVSYSNQPGHFASQSNDRSNTAEEVDQLLCAQAGAERAHGVGPRAEGPADRKSRATVSIYCHLR